MTTRGVKEWRSLPIWLRYAVILCLVLGIFLRFYHLDYKVYWIDEVSTTLRSLGHTKAEVEREMFTGEVVSVATLQQYQRLSPEKGWDDTLTALKGSAEHAPLYFLLSRLWVEWWGYSVAVMRSLPALISVLIFPGLYWLCRELFESPTVAWIAMAWVAVTPVHILYAQEARPYSLLTVITVLSSAVLLWAMRKQTRWSWLLYGITIALGLYTQLLFILVAIAQGLYVVLMEKQHFSPTVRSYLLAAGGGFLAFTPWIAVFINNFERVQASTIALNEKLSLGFLIDRWALSINLAYLDRELASANFILVAIVAFGIFFLCRHAPRRSCLFLVLLVGVTFLGLAIPDLIVGGKRSIRYRYLFPFFIGIQIILSYLFATVAVWARDWKQRFWRVVMIALILSSLTTSVTGSQEWVWWNKSRPRSSYYPLVADIINREPNVLVVSESSVSDTLALSYWLDPTVKVQLVLDNPRKLRIAPGYDPVFLLNPSKPLRRILTRRNYTLTLIYEDRTDPDDVEPRLWLVTKNPDL